MLSSTYAARGRGCCSSAGRLGLVISPLIRPAPQVRPVITISVKISTTSQPVVKSHSGRIRVAFALQDGDLQDERPGDRRLGRHLGSRNRRHRPARRSARRSWCSRPEPAAASSTIPRPASVGWSGSARGRPARAGRSPGRGRSPVRPCQRWTDTQSGLSLIRSGGLIRTSAVHHALTGAGWATRSVSSWRVFLSGTS